MARSKFSFRCRVLSACLLLGVLALGLGAVPARARPGPDEPAPAPKSDLLTRFRGLVDAMQTHRHPPALRGEEGALVDAWKRALSKRAPKLIARAEELAEPKNFVLEPGTTRAVHVDPARWGLMVRRLSAFYVELAAGVKAYDASGASPAGALARWDRANPEPPLRALTPAGLALAGINTQIALHRRLGEPVPGWLLRELSRLAALEAFEIAERAQRHRLWLADRARAHELIRERFAETKALLDAQRSLLVDQLAGLRALVALAMAAEELRLSAALGLLSANPARQAPALDLLVAMAQGRSKVERFNDERTSRWGSALRQDWLIPRDKLLKALDQAGAAPGAAAEGEDER